MRELNDVRWLARELLPAEAIGGLPHPVPLRSHLSDEVRRYVARFIENPISGGRFARKTRWLRRVPRAIAIRVLFALGYDGLLYLANGSVAGHVFFQRHGATLHAFSGALENDFAGHGRSLVFMLDFVAHAASLRGVRQARVGTGSNVFSRRLIETLSANQQRLGWSVTADGWVTFQRLL